MAKKVEKTVARRESKVKKLTKNEKGLKRMRSFIIMVYLPYFVFLALTYDITSLSISKIGWRMGGSLWLLLFTMLTVPFMLFQFFFFIKNSSHENRLLVILSIVGGLLIMVGAAMPFGVNDSHVFHDLHNMFSMCGALLALVVLTIMVSQHSRSQQSRIKMIIYGVFVLIVYSIYRIIRNAALFETGLVLCCFIILYFLNKAVALNPDSVRQEQLKRQNEELRRRNEALEAVNEELNEELTALSESSAESLQR